MACISFAAGRPFLRRHDAGGGPTSACESGWFRGRGCDVSGGGYRCCRSHRETNLGRATKVPCKVAVLVPWCYRSRSSSRAHPHRQITGSRHNHEVSFDFSSSIPLFVLPWPREELTL